MNEVEQLRQENWDLTVDVENLRGWMSKAQSAEEDVARLLAELKRFRAIHADVEALLPSELRIIDKETTGVDLVAVVRQLCAVVEQLNRDLSSEQERRVVAQEACIKLGEEAKTLRGCQVGRATSRNVVASAVEWLRWYWAPVYFRPSRTRREWARQLWSECRRRQSPGDFLRRSSNA